MPKIRVIILVIIFVFCAFFVYGIERKNVTPIERSLKEFPQVIGDWQAVKSQMMSNDVEGVLGVDDYIIRDYKGPNNMIINLYASYFTYTDRSKGYHSPLNCMPGSGWNIAGTKPISISLPKYEQKATINQLILQNGSHKQVSLYWYQCRGRILHNEYLERIYRVIDSIFENRTDGAFIRLIASGSYQDIQKNTFMLKGFAERLIPILSEYLPE